LKIIFFPVFFSLFLPFAIIKEDGKVVDGLLFCARSVFVWDCVFSFIHSSATLIFGKILLVGFTFFFPYTNLVSLKTNRVMFLSLLLLHY